MEFHCYSPSKTFVVLTADPFVGRDDGLLENRDKIATFVEKSDISSGYRKTLESKLQTRRSVRK